MERAKIFEEMGRRWPSSVVARSEVKKFTGGSVAGKTLANLDSTGEGPEGRFKIGRMTVYPVDELLKWLQCRSRDV